MGEELGNLEGGVEQKGHLCSLLVGILFVGVDC